MTENQVSYAQYELITQHIIMERHLNSALNLFGGIVLAWLDEAGAIYTIEKIRYINIVTVSMADVYFKNPGKIGENIKIFGKFTAVKSASITTSLKAVAFNPLVRTNKTIIICKIVYVCLGDNKKPTPYFNRSGLGKIIRANIINDSNIHIDSKEKQE